MISFKSTSLLAALLVGIVFITPSIEGFSQSSDENIEQAEISDEVDSEQLSKDALELKKAKERKRDIIVYTCFGLALFMILWMRKRRANKGHASTN